MYYMYIIHILPIYSTGTHKLYIIWLLLPTFIINSHSQHCKLIPNNKQEYSPYDVNIQIGHVSIWSLLASIKEHEV